jgi:hypothetical protein
MQGFGVLKAYDLATAPINISDCFDVETALDASVSFTSTVRVGFHTHVTSGEPGNWWSREITFSEYQLYRWLREHGAYDGETVLVCWAGGG